MVSTDMVAAMESYLVRLIERRAKDIGGTVEDLDMAGRPAMHQVNLKRAGSPERRHGLLPVQVAAGKRRADQESQPATEPPRKKRVEATILERLEAKVEKQESKLQGQETKVQKLEKKLQHQKTQIQDHKSKIQELEDEIKRIQEDKAQKEIEMESLQRANSDLQQQGQEQVDQRKRLSVRFRGLKMTCSDVASSIEHVLERLE
ncbi:hypothetical protein PI124_g19499 [Phytophthora idaei]|nr:hypothetical protein PI126_g19584 [Phytophthora idaei]KAG3235466.1 hypothetical protein PI124_g19499 [Phytophthora idaei]